MCFASFRLRAARLKFDQAVLSQFSRKLKKTPTKGAREASEEAVQLEAEKELDMLEEEISCFDVGDEEYVAEDNGDEIAADVEVSDALVVEDVICEASQSIRLDALPVSAANIGRVCIAKVNRELSELVVIQSTDTRFYQCVASYSCCQDCEQSYPQRRA